MKEEREKIAILGCGWLGLPLAKSLLSKGYEVKGSTTSESKLVILKNAVSSPSVYSDSFPIVEITEETTPNPDTESGKQLVIAETLLQSNQNFKTTVIRFGGLLGEDRHPVKFLAGI